MNRDTWNSETIVPCAYLAYSTNADGGLFEVRCPFCNKLERHTTVFQEGIWVKSLCANKDYKLMVDSY